MSTQAASVNPTIEWDDGVVFVFSFSSGGTQFFCGFVHIQIQPAVAVGSSVQVTNTIQQTNQQQIQFATDPESWVESIKSSARGGSAVTITFDDSTSIPYTTQTAQNFDLQLLFSIAG